MSLDYSVIIFTDRMLLKRREQERNKPLNYWLTVLYHPTFFVDVPDCSMFMLLGLIFVLTANLNISSGGGNVRRITLNLTNAFFGISVNNWIWQKARQRWMGDGMMWSWALVWQCLKEKVAPSSRHVLNFWWSHRGHISPIYSTQCNKIYPFKFS